MITLITVCYNFLMENVTSAFFLQVSTYQTVVPDINNLHEHIGVQLLQLPHKCWKMFGVSMNIV
jgi:hypothetical protein